MALEAEQNQDQEENIDLNALAQQGGDQDNQLEEQQEEAVELTAIEQKAFDQGWRPEDDFEGDKDNWKTAKEYVKDGEWIGKINDLNRKFDDQQRQFDERLSNANKLSDARRKSEIDALRKEQKTAVSMADEDAYDAAQSKIDVIEQQTQDEATSATPQQNKDPVIAAWEAKNPWINDISNVKTAVTQGIWNSFIQQNPAATNQQALAHVDTELNKLYPTEYNSNPRRNQPNSTENNQRKAKRTNKDLTMSDLTNDEMQEWNKFGKQIFKTEKAFLKTVKDTRNL